MDVEELRDELHEAHGGPATIKKDEFREHLEDEHQ